MGNSDFDLRLVVMSALLALGIGIAQAQTVYRIVGADGRVTYSDKAPEDASKATSTSAGRAPTAASAGNALPYELKQVVARYPVTLYSGAGCVPCNSGRILLQSRGIPFTENTIATPDDAEALKRISGGNSLPLLTIGGQKIKGFSEAEWNQFLTAANYPTSSQLPASYNNPPPKPLVVAQKPPAVVAKTEAPASDAEKPATQEPGVAVPPPAASPSGIRF